jgi:predicted nucleic acid-binding protein
MDPRQYNKFPIQRRYLGACPEVLHIDKETMVVWGRLVGNHKRTLPIIDSLLAATCLRRELVLVTRNTKDFNDIEGLAIINPWNYSESNLPPGRRIHSPRSGNT